MDWLSRQCRDMCYCPRDGFASLTGKPVRGLRRAYVLHDIVTVILHALVPFLKPSSCPQHTAPIAPPWSAPDHPGTAQAPADWLQGGAMVLKTVTCRFSGLRIYPGRGIQFIRTDGAVSGGGMAAWCTAARGLNSFGSHGLQVDCFCISSVRFADGCLSGKTSASFNKVVWVHNGGTSFDGQAFLADLFVPQPEGQEHVPPAQASRQAGVDCAIPQGAQEGAAQILLLGQLMARSCFL